VRLAQIAATLSATLPPNFEFVTLGLVRYSRLGGKLLIADSRFDLDSFATESWCKQHVIHEDYWKSFESCTADEWHQWLASGRSGLLGFIPLQKRPLKLLGKPRLASAVSWGRSTTFSSHPTS
jgi:hypothetical protein